MFASRSQSVDVEQTSSATRRPAEYIVSRIARSRRPSGSLAGGASSSVATCSVVRKCGSLRPMRGVRSAFAGLRRRDALAAAVAEETSQARQPAGHRRAGVLAFVQIGDVAAQNVDRHFVGRRDLPRPGP